MKIKIGENEYQPPFRAVLISTSNPDIPSGDITVWGIEDANGTSISVEGFYFSEEDASTVLSSLNELAQLRAECDGLKARVEARDKLINVMAPMHQLTCRNHKSCPICKAYDKYSKEIDGESVDTTPGGDDGEK